MQRKILWKQLKLFLEISFSPRRYLIVTNGWMIKSFEKDENPELFCTVKHDVIAEAAELSTQTALQHVKRK